MASGPKRRNGEAQGGGSSGEVLDRASRTGERCYATVDLFDERQTQVDERQTQVDERQTQAAGKPRRGVTVLPTQEWSRVASDRRRCADTGADADANRSSVAPVKPQSAAPTHVSRFFEDFTVGETLVHAVPRTVSDGDQAVYLALTGDRCPLHCSSELARSLGLQRETVNDLLVFHIVFGRTVDDVSLNAVANLGYAGLRFTAPVYPGDTLRAVSEVLGKKENSSGKTGIVWVRTRGTNQHEELVLEYVRWVMVHKRDPSTRMEQKPVVPQVPAALEVEQLHVSEALQLRELPAWATGGSRFFDDYRVGERIDHVDGMTIEESEHAMATRLYQNTAKVHFDAHAMRDSRFGKRLIYGGHVISLCRALSFRGLQNALGELAFNGGSHTAPTFAGDTLYAWSEVLDAQPIPGRTDCGALRLRLVGVKNVNPTEELVTLHQEDGSKRSYHPAVVLDLDHWVLMPRRPNQTDGV